MEALKIVSESWPFAIMFIAACVALVAFYITRQIEKSAERDRSYRAESARNVTTVKRYED
jgi:hypothetical protein